MNLLNFLLEKFFLEEKFSVIFLIVLSLILTFVSTNYLSSIVADIIQGVQTKKFSAAFDSYKEYVFGATIFLFLSYVYKIFQNRLLTKLTQWLKCELLRIILHANNENIQQINFIEFITPITRIPVSLYVLFYDVVSTIIPTFTFLIGIAAYFMYKNVYLGAFFFVSNCALFFYLYCVWEYLLDEKNKYEIKINENEKIIVDILNNIDKVIYRGQTDPEIFKFEQETNTGIDIGIKFLSNSTQHIMVMTLAIFLIFLVVLFYLIKLRMDNTIDTKFFITLVTIIIMYRERMAQLVGNLADYLEFIGKLNYIVDQFDEMLGSKPDIQHMLVKSYDTVKVSFSEIRFQDVSFRYNDRQPFVFEHLSLRFTTNNKIVGITGVSGKGKSSFVKLLLRLYDPTSGRIFIDDVDITTMDPDYIRENVTYVNQNSKLFDKKVIDNLLYGCTDINECQTNLTNIMAYPKIQKVFQNVDIQNKKAGSLGENLSGGQRQIANIIGGLINPSPMLILDEPTNALDPDLKDELLAIIQTYRHHKKCILIITHDKDVYSLFDEVLTLDGSSGNSNTNTSSSNNHHPSSLSDSSSYVGNNGGGGGGGHTDEYMFTKRFF